MSGRAVLRSTVATAATAACLCGACTNATPPSGAPPGPMSGDLVARVGDQEISARTVASIAAAQQIPAARARDLAVSDALFASEARARGLDASPAIHAEVSATLARRLLRALREEAEKAGPVTDDELRAVTERRWLELDRPEGFRTVHAVVRVPEGADEATRDKARRVAEGIRAAVAPAHDLAARTEPPASVPGRRPADPAGDAFTDAARAVPAEGLEVVVQPLAPVAAGGRVLSPEPQQFDPAFARAAASLSARGDLSPLVTSPFGVHVIMLLERIPPISIPAEERRSMIQEEVIADRARAAHAKLIQELRRQPVTLDDSVDALLALVRIEP